MAGEVSGPSHTAHHFSGSFCAQLLRDNVPMVTPAPIVGSAEKLNLARELLDDIELSRIPIEQLLLRGLRLARLMGSEDAHAWLTLELSGYATAVNGFDRYAQMTGRFTNREKRLGWWSPLPAIEQRIASLRIELQQCRVPDVQFAPSSANPNEYVMGLMGQHASNASAPVTAVINRMGQLTSDIEFLSAIRTRVLRILHDYAVRQYYGLLSGSVAESIFSVFQRMVDQNLAKLPGEPLQRIESVSERLAAGDNEAISHAMTTCRRLIDSVADVLYAPSATPIDINGRALAVGSSNHLNRIVVFLEKHCPSKSRRARLRKIIREIYERVCAGVHSDVSADEARALFIHTYATLGEIMLLKPGAEAMLVSATYAGPEQAQPAVAPSSPPAKVGAELTAPKAPTQLDDTGGTEKR